MTVTAIATSTFLSDCIIFLRDKLDTNLTDPLTGQRNGRWVMTSYPANEVKYPIITITCPNFKTQKTGFQSTNKIVKLIIECRVWARNQMEKDLLSQSLINYLRTLQYAASGSVQAKLYDFEVNSAVNIDEFENGAPKSKVIQMSYMCIIGD